MILTGKFLQILVEANKVSPLICGQLFTFIAKDHKFATVNDSHTKCGFRSRWILQLFVTFTYFVRIMILPGMHAGGTNSKFVETNVCIMVLAMSIVASERHRIRNQFPEDFVSFFNGAIGVGKSIYSRYSVHNI